MFKVCFITINRAVVCSSGFQVAYNTYNTYNKQHVRLRAAGSQKYDTRRDNSNVNINSKRESK